MPKAKERVIDYTHADMEKMTGMPRKQFDDALGRVCSLYGIDITEFKSDKENKNSGFFFPPEVAELLALLVRNIQYHPLYRENADLESITASDIAAFNQRFLNDIDDKVYPLFMEAIYCRPAHLVSYKLAAWMPDFLDQFTAFVINTCSLEQSEIGSTLEDFTQKMSEMNYHLFRGDYILKTAKEDNQRTTIETSESKENAERTRLNKNMSLPNKGIDFIVAEMLKWELIEADLIRKQGFQDYQSFARKFYPEAALREDYYSYKIRPTIPEESYIQNLTALNAVKAKRYDWSSVEESIKSGDFTEPSELDLDTKKTILRENIEVEKALLKSMEEELKRLENAESEEQPEDVFLNDMKMSYLHYCESQRKTETYKNMYKIIDKFAGRALQEIMD